MEERELVVQSTKFDIHLYSQPQGRRLQVKNARSSSQNMSDELKIFVIDNLYRVIPL